MTVTTASVLLVAILNFLKEVITVSTTPRFKLLVQIWCQMLHQLTFNIFTTTFPFLTLPYLLGGGYDLITTKDVGAQLHNKRNSPLNCLFCSFLCSYSSIICRKRNKNGASRMNIYNETNLTLMHFNTTLANT